jgi:hypothetical protein
LNEMARLLEIQRRDQWQPKEKPKPSRTDTEEAFIAGALEQQKQRYYEWLFARRLAHESRAKRVGREIIQGIGDIRATATAVDVSYFRQAMPSVLQAPITSIRTLPAALHALMSETNRQLTMAEIHADPTYPMMMQSGLEITERGRGLAAMEAEYQTRHPDIAAKLPWKAFPVKLWGIIVAASERSFSTGLNRVRRDRWKQLVWQLERRERRSITLNEAKSIATFVNNSTGRIGSKGGMGTVAVGLNQVMWSAQLQLSRIRMLTGSSIWTASPAARRLIAIQYAKMLGSIGVIVGVGLMLGGDWEEDPRSGSLGKLRFGRLRLDVFAGIPQYVAFATRFFGGWQKTAQGTIVPTRGDVPFGQRDAWKIAADFTRSKLAPIPGYVIDIASGKNVIGEPRTPWDLWRLPIPLSPADIANVAKEEGIPTALITMPLILLGGASQVYNAPTAIGDFQTELYRLERAEKKAKTDRKDFPEPDGRRLAELRQAKAAMNKAEGLEKKGMTLDDVDAEKIRTKPPSPKSVEIASKALSGQFTMTDKQWQQHQNTAKAKLFYEAVDIGRMDEAVKIAKARMAIGASAGRQKAGAAARYRTQIKGHAEGSKERIEARKQYDAAKKAIDAADEQK